MNNFFAEQMKYCVDDFLKLYNKDQYISKKTYDNFLDKYHDIFSLVNKYENKQDEIYIRFSKILTNGYEMIDRKNQDYLKKHMILEKEYFDNLFLDIDPNIMLDEEQRKAILIDEDYSLIIAGAGSGKTTTVAAKVKYLIEKKNVEPNSIILLSFTNKASEELDAIVNGKFHLNVEVLTFHKLGMKFIRNIVNKPIEISGDAGMNAILSEYFTEVIFKNKELLKQYLESFSDILRIDPICLKFKDYDEFYSYYVNQKYEECKNDLKSEIKKRINSRKKYLKTINGEYVKSEGELNIANYLYRHGIEYKYEELYPYTVGGYRSYKPDFTIFNYDLPIYVEYFGYAIQKEDGEYYSEDEKYHKEIGLKKQEHKKRGTDLIELYGKYENGEFYLQRLSYELAKRNIQKQDRTEKEIFYQLMETSKSGIYLNLLHLMKIFINVFKEKYKSEDIEILEKNCADIKIKEQLKLLKWAYIYYQRRLHEQYKIDFQDMIHYAFDKMNVLKEKKQYLKYNYVIVDEYQDISYQRYCFIKKLSDLFQAKIIAVGDDWQSIYSFSGSDMDLFTNFCSLMGYGEEIKIVKTYRNSQELIDIAGDFVLRNEEQIKKNLISCKHLEKPVKLVKYNYDETIDNMPQVLDELIQKIYSEHPQESILLLSRFNSELDNLLDSKLFIRSHGKKEKIICKSTPKMNIEFMTVHKSKGLGYDKVILLNGINGILGFPSHIKDMPIIKYLKGENERIDDINEMIEFPEERRLFYVAMTRTKNEIYIMTPEMMQYRSDFIKEIETNKNVEFYNKE